jgi:hypothetical protein
MAVYANFLSLEVSLPNRIHAGIFYAMLFTGLSIMFRNFQTIRELAGPKWIFLEQSIVIRVSTLALIS